MRGAAAVARASVSFALFACTIGPAATDGGTSSTPSAPPRIVRDQCEDVLTEYCLKAASCAVPILGLKDCIDNALPLCCTGSQCDQPSPTPERRVDACKRAIDSELCNDFVATTNPTTCLR